MKKLLILMLVLGLASAANAALVGVELSVNGVTDGSGNTTDVTLAVSTEVVIGVTAPVDYVYSAWLLIMVDPTPLPTGACGEWGDDLAAFADGANYPVRWGDDNVGAMGYGYYYLNASYPIVHLPEAGDDAAFARRIEWDDFGFGYMMVADAFAGLPTGGTQFEFIFHCCAPGQVTVQLGDLGDDAVAETIVFHQTAVPEPATMLLLGLGGLLLRRRK